MKSWIAFIFIIWGNVCFAVPAHWYKIPEKAGQDSVENKDDSILSQDLMENLRRITHVSLAAADRARVGQKSSDKWTATQMIVDLGATHRGILGIMPFKGTVATSLFWKNDAIGRSAGKSASVNSIPSQDRSSKSAFEIQFSSSDQPDHIMQKVDSVISAIARQRGLKNRERLRSDFLKMTRDFVHVAQSLAAEPNPYWHLKRIYFDRGVDLKVGGLLPLGRVGGDLRLRMGYEVKGPGNAVPWPHQPADSGVQLKTNLDSLIRILADELALATAAAELPPDWQARSFRFGLGIDPSLNVGIVRASHRAMGHLQLESTNTPPPNNEELTRLRAQDNHSPRSLWLIENESSELHQRFANDHGISTLKIKGEGGIVDDVAYHISKERLRKGLEFSLQMGRELLLGALQRSSPTWSLFRMDSSFEMSVRGDLYLALLDGQATTQMTFTKQQEKRQ